MPTGYTSAIATGIDFETFVMRCSRAWGTLITMRSDPADAEIPEKFEPSDWHLKEIKKAQLRLAQLSKMDLKQAGIETQKEYEKELKSRQETLTKTRLLRQKYNDMLCKVKAWQPPSSDHTEFKKFMVEQIEGSIRRDCNWASYYQKNHVPLLTGQEWLKKSQDKALKDIEYHIKENDGEIQRASIRTAWVQQLRKSLK